MKRLLSYFVSTRMMAAILAVFAISIAIATFIENDYGTAAARALVYNATWFEVLLFLGVVNLIAVIIKQRLYRPGKIPMFIFHIAFAVIIIGAGITRYFGSEGMMYIREGESSNTVILNDDYVSIELQKGELKKSFDFKVLFSTAAVNKFRKTISLDGEKVYLELKQFIPDAVLALVPDENGQPVIEMVTTGINGREQVIMQADEQHWLGNRLFHFSREIIHKDAVTFLYKEDCLFFYSPVEVRVSDMTDQKKYVLEARTLHEFHPRKLYKFGDMLIVLRSWLPGAGLYPRPAEDMEQGGGQDALIMEVIYKDKPEEMILWRHDGNQESHGFADFNGILVQADYGSKPVQLPFEIYLKDFIIERYPGSNSPSSYESKVTLIDRERNIREDYRVYMNKILKYRGYRFYQSSYDQDEKGTVFSVNQDTAGTFVTYTGYFLLSLGMFLSLINRRSRFRFLVRQSSEVKRSKLSSFVLVLILFVFTSFSSYAQTIRVPESQAVNPRHAASFGSLLVQDNGGRIKPVNTLSSEVLRKIARKNTYSGLSSDQVLLGMMVDPGFWQSQPMIRVGHDDINDLLGTDDKYVPFKNFFTAGRSFDYILKNQVEDAFRKKPAYRTKFDSELIRVDERVNIAYLVYTWRLLRIFPHPDEENLTWYSPATVTDAVQTKDSVFVNNILPVYFQSVEKSVRSGDWSEADHYLQTLNQYQKEYGADIVPLKSEVKLEIFYNRSDIFKRLISVYGLVGFLLIIIQFITVFNTKICFRIPVFIASAVIFAGFVLHTAGLIIRWKIAGHAPWSNGYEAMIYIAWATVLAGIVFSRGSSITLSSTAVLAALILQIAHLSWMDPQITNLVPVLRSYWLIIHVAVITGSYGFLSMAAILGFMNLLIMIFERPHKIERVDLIIKELTNTIEMTMIVGLYMLTIGTFLGGVWANESWGRYWGWDPKETWALVTVLVYAFILHMRLVPGLKSRFGFNLAALLGFSSVIMTYFGVNYYLSGLHSYAQGDPVPVPPVVYYILIIIAFVSVMAYVNQRRLAQIVKQNK